MRTTTKILLVLFLLVVGAHLGRCTLSPVGMAAASVEQPAPVPPIRPYQAGLDTAVFIEMESGHCSAALYQDQYHILTATHCVEDGNDITATTTHRGGRQLNSGQIVANDGRDHVVIRLERPLKGRPAQIAPMPPPGSPVYIYGNPSDYRFLLRIGHVAGTFKGDDGTFYYVMDISGWHGDSGGGIYDQHGNIVGTVHAYTSAHNPRSRATWVMNVTQPYAPPIAKQ